ncbi:MAG: RrF2 family transcriptional regulator [Anaerolineales bacterium]
MQITRQADYAVRAVLHLARLAPTAQASTAHIAKAEGIPVHFLAKIVSQLTQADILRTTRGARGGVSLAHPPEELSLLQVVEAIDGPVELNVCVLHPERCPEGSTCVVRPFWQEAQAILVESLGRARFSRFAQNGHPVEFVPAG